jgi:hypothetical protein
MKFVIGPVAVALLPSRTLGGEAEAVPMQDSLINGQALSLDSNCLEFPGATRL